MTTAHYRFVGGGEILLARWGENIEDAKPAFEAMADHQRSIWKKQFDREGAYTGTRWAPLSPRYAAWKMAHFPGKPILQLTGRLHESLTHRPFGVEVISGHGMTIGTDVPYARYHQDGTPVMPARPIIGPPPREDVRVFAKIMQRWIVERDVNV